jgi:hypothetical protein
VVGEVSKVDLDEEMFGSIYDLNPSFLSWECHDIFHGMDNIDEWSLMD